MSGALVLGTMGHTPVLIVYNTYYNLFYLHCIFLFGVHFAGFTIKNIVPEMSGKNEK